jgi:hypothetical protein
MNSKIGDEKCQWQGHTGVYKIFSIFTGKRSKSQPLVDEIEQPENDIENNLPIEFVHRSPLRLP